jgi:outer membrane protein assembly factor BamB
MAETSGGSMLKRSFLVSFGLLLFMSGFAGTFFMLNPASLTSHSLSNGNWPMFMGNLTRKGMNANESIITPLTASTLQYSWKFTTGGYVVASPSFVNGVMYEGSWDGYEYAIDVTTQQLLWKQFLGVTHQNKYCYSHSVGVTSSAAVDNGVVYVGGGDGYIYALNAADGTILWKTMLGQPPYYNFSSPLVYNGVVYVGLAAFCDPPFVQGKVLALSTKNGSILASVSLVPDQQTGATVWSSPALDTTSNTLYVTTGNNGSQSINQQPLAESFVALDATTLAVKDYWQIPTSQQVPDSDFGATPVLFDVNKQHYIGALNKNGIYYVLNRDDLSAGPVWEQPMSVNSQIIPGDNVSSSCYTNGVIYAASAGKVVNGITYGGTVQAFHAATGKVIWAVDLNGEVVSSVTCVHGLVVDNEGAFVQVRASSNGKVLFRYKVLRRLEGTSVIYNGALYTPSTDGSIWVFKPANTA